ncbi:MAG: bacteriohemerythrin [Burkholderiales bacterium]|nr:bacteriohemerythrin [Burkholderiales bacterium]
MSFCDLLTGLPNRAAFIDHFHVSLEKAKKEAACLALLILDLDGFGEVNERFGREAGDELLRIAAERLRLSISERDFLSRLEGDAFAVILTESASRADMLAEKIIANLNVSFHLGEGKDFRIGASVGIARYPENGLEQDRLLTVADCAMYEAKTGGGNRSVRGRVRGHGHAGRGILFDDCYLTGIQEVDMQHRKLVDLVNELIGAVGTGKRDAAIRIYEKLAAETEHHFSTEEALMKGAGYGRSDAHFREHRFLMDELRHLKGRIIEGGEIQVLQLLTDWLVTHILNADKPMGDFLRDKRASGTSPDFA